MTCTPRIFVSCEHASNRIPVRYRHLFEDRRAVLETHRGYDIGILPFAESLAAAFQAPLLVANVSRLLVDLNRSAANRTLFSEFSRHLPFSEQQLLQQHYHRPYWRTAKDIVAGIIAQNDRALHLSVHSFTPILNGKVRNADIGLLYDPSRSAEKLFCRQWQKALAATQPTLRIRRNYPYRGNAEALVTSLRQNFGENSYLGIEIEINQAIPLSGKNTWARLQQALIAALRKTLRNINA